MVPMQAIQALADQIAREFQPEQIILFGSHAYGRPHGGSDVDLLVIMRFDGDGVDKTVEIRSRVRPPFPWDLLVRGSDDTAQRYALGDPLIREALDRGRVLYKGAA
jgi:predicted nucleotidyltransferase